MKLEKKRRLEAAGWKETNVQEFLNLSDADAQYIETKLALSRRLRQLREQRRLTQTKAASLSNKPSPGTHGSGAFRLLDLLRGLFEATGKNWARQYKPPGRAEIPARNSAAASAGMAEFFHASR